MIPQQSVDKVALQARPSHCGRRQGARPSPILRFGEGAQRSHSATRAGRSPDGLFQRAAKVYIETSIPSFHDETRTEPEMAAKRTWTRQSWDERREGYEIFTGDAVIDDL